MTKNTDFLQIKPFRERKRLKPKDLAKALGANMTTYYNWENGQRDPSFNVVKKLFEMGATIEELYGVQVPLKEIEIPKDEFDRHIEKTVVNMIKSGNVFLGVRG